MDFKKALPLVDRFLTWVTLGRVFSIGITAAIAIASWTLFENRSQVADGISNRGNIERQVSEEVFKLSDASKDRIKELVTHDREIVLVSVVSVNMRVLQRTPVHYFTLDKTVEQLIKSYSETRSTSQPLFAGNDKDDGQVIALLNGEFSCAKFDDTINSSILPGVRGKVKTVCRVGLPPYHGYFAGYITFLMSTELTPYRAQEVRLLAVQLATSIYLGDIVGKGK